MMHRAILLTAAALAALALSGCTGSSMNQGPVGVGPAVNELKGSPCACIEIPMAIPVMMG